MNANDTTPDDRQEQDERPADANPSSNDEGLTEYDKTLADSFPSSDPPAQP